MLLRLASWLDAAMAAGFAGSRVSREILRKLERKKIGPRPTGSLFSRLF
jgi:hypothetical protein